LTKILLWDKIKLVNMDYFLCQKINSLAGQWLWLDVVGIFCAEFLIWFLPILLVLFYFLANQQQRLNYRRHFIQAIVIIIITWLISQLIGLAYFRPRPFVTHPSIYQLVIAYSKKSFPSDHAALAFALAFVIMLTNKRLGILFLIFAILIGLSRIFGGVHYPSDILGGLLVALLSTWLVKKIRI
jgi:undecaprenyl-diphosphatase